MTSTEPSPRPGLIRRTVRKHGAKIVAACLLGSAALAYAVHTSIKPTFESYSLIRVTPPAATTLYGVQTSGENFDSYLSTLVSLIGSPNVMHAAAADRKAASLPRIKDAGDVVQELRKAIVVTIVPDTYLIKVSMTSDDPQEAAIVVNAVVDAFFASNNEFVESMNKKQIKSFDQYLAELRNQTDALELRWKELVAKGDVDAQVAQQAGKPAGDGQSPVSVDQWKRLSDELFNIHLELLQAEAWAEALRLDVKQAGPEMDNDRIEQLVERRFRADPEVAELESKLAAARKKLDEIKKTQATAGDPAEVAAQRKFDSLRAQFNDLWASNYRNYRKQIVETTGASSDQELREAESRVRSLKVKQAALKAEAGRIKVSTGRSATDEVEIELLKEKRESLKAMQETVTRRLEQLKFEARNETRVVQMNKAVPATRPIVDRRPLLMLAIPFAMLFTAFGLFAGFEASFGAKVPPEKPIATTE